MKRESALLTWWYLTIGGIVTVLAAALPSASWREAMYLVAAVQLAPVLLYSYRRGLTAAPMAALLAAVGLLYATAQLLSGDSPTYETPVAMALGLVGTACIIGCPVLLRPKGLRKVEPADLSLVGWLASRLAIWSSIFAARAAGSPWGALKVAEVMMAPSGRVDWR